MQTKKLPYQPLDSVASHRIADFFGDTDTQAMMREGVGEKDDGKCVTLKTSTRPINALKLFVGSQEMLLRQRIKSQRY